MLKLTCNDDFTAEYTVETDGAITYVKINAKAKAEAKKLQLDLRWRMDCVGANLIWAPMRFKDKSLPPTWQNNWPDSCAMSCAPVTSLVGYGDENRITVASSDAKNKVKLQIAVVEATAEVECGVFTEVGCYVSEYSAVIRIDRRNIPFYEAVADVSRWWETFPGYESVPVPDIAKRPMYSTWYSYHQDIDTERFLEECRYFKALGCDAIIVDDGWQISKNGGGYVNCGDWEVSPDKIADIKAFSDAVHETGMKLMLWFSIPFLGKNSKVRERFKDKTLYDADYMGVSVLDPRYPDVREYLIGIYENAAKNWGLDGLKLDFIDSFCQSEEVKEGMDYVSCFDAVDRLMKDVVKTLKAVKPDMLIEFRQSYIGPLMRTFGNIFRSGDCPEDSLTNRLNILSLRQTSGETAVHSDMIMWHKNEPAEQAAYQLTNVLFSVPQISVSCSVITEEQKKMLANYLSFWNKYRDVLLSGRMTYKGYASNYDFVSSELGETLVGAIYGGGAAKLSGEHENIVLVNAEPETEIIVDIAPGGNYTVLVTDCCGNKSYEKQLSFKNPAKLSVPVNGYIYITK